MGGGAGPEWSKVKLDYENVHIVITDAGVVVKIDDKAPVTISRADGSVS